MTTKTAIEKTSATPRSNLAPGARRRRARMEKLVQLKHVLHLTNKEAAEELGICERSVYNLLGAEEYTTIVDEMRDDWREAAITETHSLGPEVLATMRDIMTRGRSEIARYNAAAKVGDWIGLQRLADEQHGDDRAEVERLIRIREETAAQLGARGAAEGIVAYMDLLQPGGFLPSDQMSDTGHMLMDRHDAPPEHIVEPDREAIALDNAIEARFRLADA